MAKAKFSIHYESRNSYPDSTSMGTLDYLLFPENNDVQNVLSSQFTITPKCSYTIVKNYEGFPVLRVSIDKSIEELKVDFKAEVLKSLVDYSSHAPIGFYALDFEKEVEYYRYLKETTLTQIPSEHNLLKLKQKLQESTFDYLLRVCSEIKNYVTYTIHSTNVRTTASESLSINAGVCQDFSHILLGVCRHRKMASRYVSGYLFTTHHEAQLHAWVEVYFPEIGWVGFDPANNCIVNENYIKIAHGKDYSDCCSVKGLITTSGYNFTEYSIRIQEIEQQNQQNQAQ